MTGRSATVKKKMKWRKWVALLTGFCLLLSLCSCNGIHGNDMESRIRQTAKAMQKQSETKYLLEDEERFPGGDSSGDWTALVLKLSGRKDAYETYLNRLTEYVGRAYQEKGYLHQIKATEYHRIALTMCALGGDPTQIEYGGMDIDLVADGSYRFPGGSPGLQGANGIIYALLTLDAVGYEIPDGEPITREELVKELLSFQKPDGGFCLDNGLESDVDITAMALQALAPYREEPEAEYAVETALIWLKTQMTENGAFVSYGMENTESCAQVILALCALKTDPAESSLVTKGGKTVLDGMEFFRLDSGLYSHVKGEEADWMATYQALLALEAVEKLRGEQRWILDFTGTVSMGTGKEG